MTAEIRDIPLGQIEAGGSTQMRVAGIDDNLLFDLQVLLDRYGHLTPKMIDQLDAREIQNDLIVIEGGRR